MELSDLGIWKQMQLKIKSHNMQLNTWFDFMGNFYLFNLFMGFDENACHLYVCTNSSMHSFIPSYI